MSQELVPGSSVETHSQQTFQWDSIIFQSFLIIKAVSLCIILTILKFQSNFWTWPNLKWLSWVLGVPWGLSYNSGSCISLPHVKQLPGPSVLGNSPFQGLPVQTTLWSLSPGPWNSRRCSFPSQPPCATVLSTPSIFFSITSSSHLISGR